MIVALALIGLAFAPSWAGTLRPSPEKTVTAKKGPVQITLRLYKTKVKSQKSLWYQIELKNVGKKRIRIEDRIFKDPWAIRGNIRDRFGIYLDVMPPPGRYSGNNWPLQRNEFTPLLRRPVGGLGLTHRDWHGRGYSPEDKQKLADLEARLKREGRSDVEIKVARSQWIDAWIARQEMDEDTDPKNQSWLEPGASTTTMAWAYRDPDPSPYLHTPKMAEMTDEEPQVGDYAQLFDIHTRPLGRWKIRAVYDHGLSAES